jgi:hypothetical protein
VDPVVAGSSPVVHPIFIHIEYSRPRRPGTPEARVEKPAFEQIPWPEAASLPDRSRPRSLPLLRREEAERPSEAVPKLRSRRGMAQRHRERGSEYLEVDLHHRAEGRYRRARAHFHEIALRRRARAGRNAVRSEGRMARERAPPRGALVDQRPGLVHLSGAGRHGQGGQAPASFPGRSLRRKEPALHARAVPARSRRSSMIASAPRSFRPEHYFSVLSTFCIAAISGTTPASSDTHA